MTTFVNMSLHDLNKLYDKHIKEKEAGKAYREKYRKTPKGTAAHNRASRRTYFKKKLGNLPTENLTEKQTENKIKWQAILTAEYPDTPAQTPEYPDTPT